MRRVFLLFWGCALAVAPAHAMKVAVGPAPLQRALVRQLFATPDGRYGLRGHPGNGCYLAADHPQLSFRDNRVVLQLHIAGNIGSSVFGSCLGVNWSGDAVVSMLPQAQGTDIGFTDVRVEKLTENHDIDKLLSPLLTRAVPRAIKVDAAELARKLLVTASTKAHSQIDLQSLSLSGMQVDGQFLVLEFDGAVQIQ